MEEEPTYRNPIAVSLEESETAPGSYKMHMYLGDEEVGFCRLEERPDGSYYVAGIVIYSEYQSETVEGTVISEHAHLGSDLLECVNDFLKSENALGYLSDTMEDDTKSGMYADHGWIPLESNLYVYDGTKPVGA